MIVRVAAETDHLVSQNGQNRIPVSQLKHRLDGGFTPLSVSSTQFYLSNDPDDVQVPLDFLMEVTWLDTADTHEVVLVFTASKM
ncbi:MAG: hypothetical protein NUW23_13830 [Firmicutes bacterium]|nr:hypothetical protein [Bacillota bacterium]